MNAIRSWLTVVCIACSTGVFGTSAVVLMLLGITGRAIDWHATIWSRTVAWLAGMKMTVTGKRNVDPEKSYMMVVNHRSHLDSTALYVHSPVPIRMLAKAELFKVIVLGRAMKLAGHVPIHRDGGKTDMRRLKVDVKELILDEGRSLCVFPEGSRQRPGRFGDYKMGAFFMAKQFNLPILPVSIEGTGKVLPTKTLRFHTGEVRMRFHPVVAIEGKTPEELHVETKRIIEAGCLELRRP